MGLISSIKTLSGVPDLAVNDADMSRITDWLSAYQGHASWLNYRWEDNQGREHGDRLMSLQMPKVAAKKMSSLVFNQAATITAYPKGNEPQAGRTSPNDDDNEPNKMLQAILSANHFYDNMERYLEYCFGSGGVAAREYVYNGEVKIRFATADAFIPLSSDANGVTECVIATQFVNDGKNYTLLEWHTEDDNFYHIKNQLFKSTSADGSDLGVEVPLTDVYANLKPQADYSKQLYSRPTFQYLKPNLANNFNLNSPLGIPIYANAMDTLRQLDQAYDMLMQEMVMGRRRIIAPDWMLKLKTDPHTGKERWAVDWRDRAYQVFRGDQNGQNADGIKDITSPLRNEQLIATINNLLKIFAAQTGFSAGTFSYDAVQGQQTATEVISQNSDTYQSKNSHETLVSRFIQDIATSCLELAKNAPSVKYNASAEVTIMVNFDDSIAKDRDENAKYYQLMNGNKPLMPHLESIKRANGLDDQTAASWQQEIEDEEPKDGDMDSILKQSAGEDDGA